MKYLTIPLLLLTGCVSDGLMPATVQQINVIKADLKRTAQIVDTGFSQTKDLQNTQVAFAAKHNAENLELRAEPSSFEFMGESIMGLLMTSMGLGGVQVARKRIAKAKLEDPNKPSES